MSDNKLFKTQLYYTADAVRKTMNETQEPRDMACMMLIEPSTFFTTTDNPADARTQVTKLHFETLLHRSNLYLNTLNTAKTKGWSDQAFHGALAYLWLDD